MDNHQKWDLRMLHLAREVASWSKDPSTQTGAVITDDDYHIISVGYNGFPSRMPDNDYLYENREEKYSRIIHCEMNAVLNSARPVRGGILYTWPFLSCDRCATHMIQAGMREVVAPSLPVHLYDRWLESVNKSKSYFAEAKVIVTEYDIDRLDPFWA